jgi:P pilus assembly chaperone PapD
MMMFTKRSVFSMAALMVFFFSPAIHADLIVNRSIVIYNDSEVTKEDIVVFNSDETENLYLEVQAFRVRDPGSDAQEMVALSPKDGMEFLVSPNRLIVPPRGRSIVRMLDLLPREDQERIYRVNIVPVSAPADLEVGEGARVESKLNIVIAYQVLAMVLPENPRPVVEASRRGIEVSFRNPGNANYLLTDGEQCNPVDPGECVALVDHRVYPGNEWNVELPFDGPFQYKVRTQDGLISTIFE